MRYEYGLPLMCVANPGTTLMICGQLHHADGCSSFRCRVKCSLLPRLLLVCPHSNSTARVEIYTTFSVASQPLGPRLK